MDEVRIESIKTAGRFLIIMIAGWVLTQVMNQISVVPEQHHIQVWKFVFVVPVRMLVQMCLSMSLAFLDRLKFLDDKDKSNSRVIKYRGLVPF